MARTDRNKTFEAFLIENNKTLSHAIRAIHTKLEYEALEQLSKALADWAARRAWLSGYDPKDAVMVIREYDYSRQIGLLLELNIEKKQTVNQFCYQFVSIADAIEKELWTAEHENKTLKEDIRAYKKSRFYKLWRYFNGNKKEKS